MTAGKRVQQVQATLLRAIQEEIGRGLHDPRVSGLITVTGVDVSPDLKNATVMVSVFPAEKQDLTMYALRDAARHLRRRVGDRIAMHEVPELIFRVDESIKKQAEILSAFSKIQQERAEKGDSAAADGENE
jgi:ribosome-binding factor A